MAKLTQRQKANIQAKWDTGNYTKVDLAKSYKVSEKVIRKVLKINTSRVEQHKYIYFITCDTYKDVDIYKIGISNDATERLKTLQTACPFKLYIDYSELIPFARDKEKEIHNLLKDLKLEGEWFRINEALKTAIIKYLKESKDA